MTLDIPDAPTFFRLSCGSWRSQRSVHHLLHRRSEAGGSLVVVEDLELNDERLLAMARQHQQDPGLIIGQLRALERLDGLGPRWRCSRR